MRVTSRKREILILIIACFLLLNATLVRANSEIKFYVFYEYECYTCLYEIEPLIKKYSFDNIVLMDCRQAGNAERYYHITKLTGYLDTPVIGVFKNDSLVAIVSKYFPMDAWEKIIETRYDGVPIYVEKNLTPIKIIKENETITALSKLFKSPLIIQIPQGAEKYYEEENETEAKPPEAELPEVSSTNVISLLPLIVLAASADAINPCTFYVFVILLSIVFFRSGKKDSLKIGLPFVLSIYIAYFLVGLGLLQLYFYASAMRYFIVILGFAIGLRAMLNFAFGILGISLGLRNILGNFLTRTKIKHVPDAFSKKISILVRKAAISPIFSFFAGILCGAFLLPCTSGPYLIAVAMISSLENVLGGLFLLVIYNFIIIIPLLMINLGVYALKVKTKSLKIWSTEKRRWLDLIVGLIMIFLCIYLLYETPTYITVA